MNISKLPTMCIQYIQDFNETIEQFRLCSINKFFINNIKITLINDDRLIYKYLQAHISSGRFKFNVRSITVDSFNEYNTSDIIQAFAHSLRRLDISYCLSSAKQQISPELICNLNLEELSISSNDFNDNNIRKLRTKLKVLEIGSSNDNLTDKFLLDDNGKYDPNMQLEILTVSKHTNITDKGIIGLPLKCLFLNNNKNITDNSLRTMQLQSLSLIQNQNITDNGIKHMTNLRTLNLRNNDKITNDGIKDMVNMDELKLTENKIITDDGIKNMKHLSVLYLAYNKKITDGALMFMNLRTLDISDTSISGKAIKHMNNLENLYLENNSNVYDDDIKHLKLKRLAIPGKENKITNAGIKDMKLVYLDCENNENITNEGIKHMNLNRLIINNTITEDAIKHMKLKSLVSSYKSKIPYKIVNYKKVPL